MQPATTPPGRVTRAISRTPAVGVAHERDHERGERGVERAVVPRQLLGARPRARRRPGCASRQASANCSAGSIAATWSAPSRAASSRVSPPGPQPTSSARMPGCDPGRVGERDRERRDVAAHEAVVVLGGRGELHVPSQPPHGRPRQAVRSADAHARGPRDGGRSCSSEPGSRPRRRPRSCATADTRADFNLHISSARNMFCRTARRDLRRHRAPIGFRFRTPGGFSCKRVSGNALGGQWRCVKGRQGLPLRVQRLMGARRRKRKLQREELDEELEERPRGEGRPSTRPSRRADGAGAGADARGPAARAAEDRRQPRRRRGARPPGARRRPRGAGGRRRLAEGEADALRRHRHADRVGQRRRRRRAGPGRRRADAEADELGGPGEISVVLPDGRVAERPLPRPSQRGEPYKTVEIVVPTAGGGGLAAHPHRRRSITGYASSGGGEHPLATVTLKYAQRTLQPEAAG